PTYAMHPILISSIMTRNTASPSLPRSPHLYLSLLPPFPTRRSSDLHYTGLDMSRDVKGAEYHDFAKIQEGGICPHCGKPTITISRGIEVGNIFQLGTKYTRSMNMTYIDSNGETQYPLMGCYGIGIGRLAASICEAHHDDYGPIWPMAVAPWQVHLCAVRA